MGLNTLGLAELITRIRKGEASPYDAARDVAEAVAGGNAKLGAYLHFDADRLLETARALTESGDYKNTPLCGAPIALKDNIVVEGGPTTCGSKILGDYRSPYPSTVARRLTAAGAVIAGKTNLDEFAMGSSTENSAFGPTKNPWDPRRAPGGSSGGSAAAVAADMAIAALGSDTGGSIRQPASFCGVVGMKPTYGRVSRYGLVAFASSLDQIGPLTKGVEDTAILLGAICGEDPNDATTVTAPVPDFTTELDRDPAGLRIGVPRDFITGGMDSEVEANFQLLIDRLADAKATVIDVAMPNARYAVACYYIIANAEASSNLARYDGVKYGYRAKDYEDLRSMYTRTRDEGFGDEVKRRVLLGTYVLSAGYYDAYYVKAQKVRSLIIGDFNRAFDTCDLVMLPTSPTPAFKIGEKTADPLTMYLSDVFTIPVNLAGLPGISIPSGLSGDGLPFGVQFVGKALDEVTVVRGARAAEKLIDFKERPRA